MQLAITSQAISRTDLTGKNFDTRVNWLRDEVTEIVVQETGGNRAINFARGGNGEHSHKGPFTIFRNGEKTLTVWHGNKQLA